MTERSLTSNDLTSLESLRLRTWRELPAIFMIAMELSWWVPSFRNLSIYGAALPVLKVYFMLGGLLSSAFLLTRVTYILNLEVISRRLVLLLLMIVSVLIMLNSLLFSGEIFDIRALSHHLAQSFADPSILVPAEFAVILMVFLIWLRGVTLAQKKIGTNTVLSSFRIGVAMFLTLYLLNQFTPWETAEADLYLFLLTGLVATGVSRASTVGYLRGGRQSPLDGNWLVKIVCAAGILVLSAFGVAGFASGYLAQMIAQLTLLITRVLLVVSILLLSPLLLLILFLLSWVFDSLLDFSFVQQRLAEVFDILIQLMNWLGELVQGYVQRPLDIRWLKPYFLWGTLLLIIFFLVWHLGRRWRPPGVRHVVTEKRQSLSRPDDLAKLLRVALKRNFHKLMTNLRKIQRGRRLLAAARIRRIYSQLMRMCEELESPRLTAQTPMEFLPTLERLFPNRSGDLACITEAYQRVRYGELPETREELAQVEAAWRIVREEGEILRLGEQTRRRDKGQSSL